MSVTTDLRPLSVERKLALRPLAQGAVLSAAIFAGVAIALQIAILAPYPGTGGDPLMKVFSYTAVFAVLGTSFKFAEVIFLGPLIERKLGTNRRVRLRGIFNREIRATAIWGGVLQAIYVLLFISLVRLLAPTALASARACVVFALAILEVAVRILPRDKKTLARVILSVFITFTGACIVVFANGFTLFKGDSVLPMVLFLCLVGPGNFCLALAEWAEYKGVHKQNTAAGVYTLARFVTFSLTCLVGVVVWGAMHGEFSIFWATAQMCAHRWYFLIPIALFWGTTDLVRICSKTVVPATYMYLVGSLSVVIDAITQSIARVISPKTYALIPQGWQFLLICVGGGIIVSVGTIMFPHPRKNTQSVPTNAPPSG